MQQATSASPCIPYKFRDIEKINIMNLANRDQSGLKPSQAGHQLHSQPSHAPQWRISDGPTKMKEHFYWLVEDKPTSGIHLAFHRLWGGVPTTIGFQMRNPKKFVGITIT